MLAKPAAFCALLIPLCAALAAADPVHEALSRAVELFQSGGRPAGLALADSVARAEPGDARPWSVMGQLAWFADDRARSLHAFERVLEIDPDHLDARIYMKRLRFVPEDFDAPILLITDDFQLRPLRASDAERDFAAVMSSVERLQGVFGPAAEDWPEGLTPEEDREVLAWHEKEFEKRSGFVYTVLSRFGRETLGCFYVYPSRRDDFDAELVFWVAEDAARRGLEEKLEHDLRFWMKDKWPFERVAWPGRSMSWDAFLGEKAVAD